MKIAFMTLGTINSSLSYRPLSLAKELVKRGHEVFIFSPRFDKYSEFKDTGVNQIDGVKIIRPFQLKNFSFELGLVIYIASSIRILFKLKPEIIHIYKSNPITIFGFLLKMLKGTPVILDVDDLDAEVMKIEKNSIFKVKLVELSEKISGKYSNAITAASKYLKKYYSGNYKEMNIQYVPNGGSFISTPKECSRSVFGNRIIFIGNMNRKNILEPIFHVVNDIKRLKLEIHATIIGDGRYLSYFKNLSKELGILNNVTFIGHVPQADLGKFIKRGDLGYCYMPNELTTRACSSMKVFQYMQYGAIPVVSDVGDLPSYVFHGRAGYVVRSGNNNLLTKEILKALSNIKIREEKLIFIQKKSTKIFAWSALAIKVEDVYKKIIWKK